MRPFSHIADSLLLILDYGPEAMTEEELGWLWDQLRGYNLESTFIKDLIIRELKEKVQEWARMIEARRGVDKKVTFKEFNPDAMSREELKKFGRETRKANGRVVKAKAFFLGRERRDYVAIYRSLGIYASIKARAMAHREKGRIRMALALEEKLEKIYKDLPKWARW